MDNYEKKETALAEKSLDNSTEKAAVELYGRTDHLIGNFNDSFHELTKALEIEQAKLLELEERRKKIQEEMKNLKIEIQEEKVSFEEDMTRVTNEHIAQSSLADPVDVLSFNIDLKSEFMREFLASKTEELRSQMQRNLRGTDHLYDIKEEDEDDLEESPRPDVVKDNNNEELKKNLDNTIAEKSTDETEKETQEN